MKTTRIAPAILQYWHQLESTTEHLHFIYIPMHSLHRRLLLTHNAFTLDRRNTFHDVECKMEEKRKERPHEISG